VLFAAYGTLLPTSSFSVVSLDKPTTADSNGKVSALIDTESCRALILDADNHLTGLVATTTIESPLDAMTDVGVDGDTVYLSGVKLSDVTDPARLLALTRRALAEAVQPKVSYEVDVAALDADDAGLGDTVAVIDTSRDPEWRLKARIVRRMRTFGDSVVARVTIGTVQPVDYVSVSSLAADVAALQSDVTGIDGNLTTAASVTVVENTVTTAIDDLDELAEVEF